MTLKKIEDLEENAEIENIQLITDPLYDRVNELEKQKKEYLAVFEDIKNQLFVNNNEKLSVSEFNIFKNRISREEDRIKNILPIYAHKSDILKVSKYFYCIFVNY